ncbi:MAG: alpha/beta hydrolase fold domain-containing protein, partial [Asticcacaulis sp.]
MRSSLLRLWLLRRVLSLPPAILRFFSGGGVIYRGEATLDPQMQFLWRTWFAPGSTTARMPLGLNEKSVDTAREEWRDMAGFLAAPNRLKVRVETIGDGSPAGPSAVTGMLLRPPRIAADAPLLVFFPQGGGVLGGPELSRAFCTVFAAQARCPVFIPTLRLAPEHRFPAALDDARLALDWAMDNAHRLGAEQGTVAVGGALTGAGLAACVSVERRRASKPQPVAQLLVTPLIDLSDAAPASNPYAGL